MEEQFSSEEDYDSEANISEDEIEIDEDEDTPITPQFNQSQLALIGGQIVQNSMENQFYGFTHALPGEESMRRQEGIIPPTLQMTPVETRIFIADLILQYGLPKDENATLRFIVGRTEINKAPGRGPGEIDKIKGENVKGGIGGRAENPNKRNWNKLKEFAKKYNWRHILSDDFQGDYKHREAMPFVIDEQEWKTVTHYLLGMLYASTPAYSILFSVESRDNDNGFWGDVRAAEREHFNNVRTGLYPIDLDFPSKLEGYLKKAYLAKFTQNPIARQALLLTQNAVISKRGTEERILDVPIYAVVRDFIKNNPKLIYKGDNKIEQEFEELPEITSAEELNVLENGKTKVYKSLSIKSLVPNADIENMEIEDRSCIIYLATGEYEINIQDLIKNYGTPHFVKRPIYGLERVGDNLNQKIMIAIQTTPTSITTEYIAFQVKIVLSSEDEQRNSQIVLYLQPLQNQKYSVFILAAEKHNSILDFLRSLIGIQIKITETPE